MTGYPLSVAAKPHILVVDDDDRLRDLLRRYLAEQDFIVSTARGAAEARQILTRFSYDLMVLDIMMPGESGLALTKQLRMQEGAAGHALPILLLTARGETGERIEGLEAGADDYLTKPFEPKELLLRINAILRRAGPSEKATLSSMRLGRWLYEPATDTLTDGDEALRLTGMEAGLLRLLAAESGTPISREVLAERSEGVVNDRTIDVQVTRLRRKIERDPRNPRCLLTVRGEGYMLVPEQGGGA